MKKITFLAFFNGCKALAFIMILGALLASCKDPVKEEPTVPNEGKTVEYGYAAWHGDVPDNNNGLQQNKWATVQKDDTLGLEIYITEDQRNMDKFTVDFAVHDKDYVILENQKLKGVAVTVSIDGGGIHGVVSQADAVTIINGAKESLEKKHGVVVNPTLAIGYDIALVDNYVDQNVIIPAKPSIKIVEMDAQITRADHSVVKKEYVEFWFNNKTGEMTDSAMRFDVEDRRFESFSFGMKNPADLKLLQKANNFKLIVNSRYDEISVNDFGRIESVVRDFAEANKVPLEAVNSSSNEVVDEYTE